jgi:hypothetical protein
VDGWNYFNLYAFSRVAKSFGSEFSNSKGRELLEPLLASMADRVIRIVQPSEKLIRIIDEGYVMEYMPLPPRQVRFDDFDFSEKHCTERIKQPLTGL